jgi:hypothetical protein
MATDKRLVADVEQGIAAGRALLHAAAAAAQTHNAVHGPAATLSAAGWRAVLLRFTTRSLEEIRRRGAALAAAPKALREFAEGYIGHAADEIRGHRWKNPGEALVWSANRDDALAQLREFGLSGYDAEILAVDHAEREWPHIFGDVDDPARRADEATQSRLRAESACAELARCHEIFLLGLQAYYQGARAEVGLARWLVDHVAAGAPPLAPPRAKIPLGVQA